MTTQRKNVLYSWLNKIETTITVCTHTNPQNTCVFYLYIINQFINSTFYNTVFILEIFISHTVKTSVMYDIAQTDWKPDPCFNKVVIKDMEIQ
jgi:hypothetical protein